MLLIAGIVHLQQELVIGLSVNHQNHLHSTVHVCTPWRKKSNLLNTS